MKPKKYDTVNNPKHYTDGRIEVIDFIEDNLTPEEFRGYLKGNILKYILRADKKDRPKQDLQKSEWYLKKLIKKSDDYIKDTRI